MTFPHHVADTVPYPWPYDGRLQQDRVALVICGAQGAIVAAAADATGVHDKVADLAATVRAGGGIVVWIRHGAGVLRGRPTPFLPVRDSAEWQLVDTPEPGDEIIDSLGWDGCFGSGLDHVLRSHGSPLVLLAGYASEITVDSTVRTLNDQGHECLVLTDGCAPLDPHLGARAHHSLTMSGGIFGALGTVEAALAALAQPTNTAPTNTAPTHDQEMSS